MDRDERYYIEQRWHLKAGGRSTWFRLHRPAQSYPTQAEAQSAEIPRHDEADYRIARCVTTHEVVWQVVQDHAYE
jgi:hypothetical protein